MPDVYALELFCAWTFRRRVLGARGYNFFPKFFFQDKSIFCKKTYFFQKKIFFSDKNFLFQTAVFFKKKQFFSLFFFQKQIFLSNKSFLQRKRFLNKKLLLQLKYLYFRSFLSDTCQEESSQYRAC